MKLIPDAPPSGDATGNGDYMPTEAALPYEVFPVTPSRVFL